MRSDLDAFIALLQDGVPSWNGEGDLVSMPQAVVPSRTPLNEMVELIRSHRLTRIAIDHSRRGIETILVDPTEIRAKTFELPRGHVSVTTAAELLGYSRRVVSGLVGAGIIPSDEGCNPKMRYAYRTVDIADIEYFDTEYISLFALASKMGVDPRRAQRIVR